MVCDEEVLEDVKDEKVDDVNFVELELELEVAEEDEEELEEPEEELVAELLLEPSERSED